MWGRPSWGCAGGLAMCAMRCLVVGWAGGGNKRTLEAERAFFDLGRRSVVEGWVVDRASGGHRLIGTGESRGTFAWKLRPPSQPGKRTRAFRSRAAFDAQIRSFATAVFGKSVLWLARQGASSVGAEHGARASGAGRLLRPSLLENNLRPCPAARSPRAHKPEEVAPRFTWRSFMALA